MKYLLPKFRYEILVQKNYDFTIEGQAIISKDSPRKGGKVRTFVLKTNVKNMRYASIQDMESPGKKFVSNKTSESGSNHLMPDFLKRKSMMEPCSCNCSNK